MAKKKQKQTRRKFGKLRKLPSGRYQASFIGLDGERYTAPNTFLNEVAAENWLSDEEKLINRSIDYGDTWVNPKERSQQEAKDSTTVLELVELWLNKTEDKFKDSTKQSHRRQLDLRVLRDSFPGFDSLANEKVVEVDSERVLLWWEQVQANWDTPTTNAGAYKRLATAFRYAVARKIIDKSPVFIKGATEIPEPENYERELIEVEEAALLAENISPRLKVPIKILTWCGLRLGELLELRRKDIEDKAGVMTIKIRRNTQRLQEPGSNKSVMVSFDTPKTKASRRDIVVPSKIAEEIRVHLSEYVAADPEALIVTTEKGNQMLDTTFRNRFNLAAEQAGRPDITPHDLRRFFGTHLVRDSGIGLSEARKIMGHRTVEMVLRYQRDGKKFRQRAASNLDKLIGE